MNQHFCLCITALLVKKLKLYLHYHSVWIATRFTKHLLRLTARNNLQDHSLNTTTHSSHFHGFNNKQQQLFASNILSSYHPSTCTTDCFKTGNDCFTCQLQMPICAIKVMFYEKIQTWTDLSSTPKWMCYVLNYQLKQSCYGATISNLCTNCLMGCRLPTTLTATTPTSFEFTAAECDLLPRVQPLWSRIQLLIIDEISHVNSSSFARISLYKFQVTTHWSIISSLVYIFFSRAVTQGQVRCVV